MIAARRPYTVPLTDGRVLDLSARPLVMGILNVTPDSFADAWHPRDAAEALELGLRMEADGADIIDVGGESTRPGADPVPTDEERRRVLPAVRALAARVRIPISVDTYKASVAEAAIGEGAAMVNDVSGLGYEPGLADVVGRTGAGLVLMHNRGRSKTMYQQADYSDVVSEAIDELAGSVRAATAAGVRLESIVIDPGIGFAKRAADSYGVLARLAEFATGLDRPLLAGPSRKSFMRDALGDRPAADRDWGTAAAVAAAVLAGAHIVRVHAVAAMVQVVRVAEAIRKANRVVG